MTKEIRYKTPDRRVGRILCEDDRQVAAIESEIAKIGGDVVSTKSVKEMRTLKRKKKKV